MFSFFSFFSCFFGGWDDHHDCDDHNSCTHKSAPAPAPVTSTPAVTSLGA